MTHFRPAIPECEFRRAFSWSVVLALVLLVLTLSGCTQRAEDAERLQATGAAKLRVGVLPDESLGDLHDRFDPLMSYLGRRLGIRAEIVVAPDYESLVRQFRKGQVDIAYFGGVTFLQAHRQTGAVPLVMRDVDLRFTSYFLSSARRAAQGLQAFRDGRFAFGAEFSTSGHWMPRAFLLHQGIEPEQFFSEVRYSSSHDMTVNWVRNGIVDLGAVNAVVIDSMLENGELHADEVAVVAVTPPYANYVWAVHPSMEPTRQAHLREAFLALDLDNSEDAAILNAQAAGGFLPATLSDFAELAGVLDEVSGGHL